MIPLRIMNMNKDILKGKGQEIKGWCILELMGRI